ncbi:MAG: hypothetical protein ABW072_16115 [Sedimenticola sp.]
MKKKKPNRKHSGVISSRRPRAGHKGHYIDISGSKGFCLTDAWEKLFDRLK